MSSLYYDRWSSKLLSLFLDLSCSEISQETAVNPVDIVSTLQSLQMLKYWKGKHLVLKRQVSENTFHFYLQPKCLQTFFFPNILVSGCYFHDLNFKMPQYRCLLERGTVREGARTQLCVTNCERLETEAVECELGHKYPLPAAIISRISHTRAWFQHYI